MRLLAHGVSQGLITQLRGGNFRSGMVGAVAGGLSPAGDMLAQGVGNIVSRSVIAAVFGGLAAQASGGSFADGALSAAMVHLFNDEARRFPSPQELMKNLGFNRSGEKLGWGYCLSRMSQCWVARSAANEAKDAMRQAFPTVYNATDNQADAFRHAYWSMSIAQNYGYDIARSITNAYESDHDGSDVSSAMDIYNNHIGAVLGAANPNVISMDSKIELILNSMDKGFFINNTWNLEND